MMSNFDRGRGPAFRRDANRGGGTARGPGGVGPTGGANRPGIAGERPEGWPTEAQLHAIITENKPADLIQSAEAIGKHLAIGLSSSQVRNAFAAVRAIDLRWPYPMAEHDLLRLKPLLAYQVGRASGTSRRALQDLELVLVPAIEKVGSGDDERFRRFMDFFEAILAYHKRYGGK